MSSANLRELLLSPRNIQVSAYDPGGANVLAPLIKRLEIETEFSIAGQAIKIFKSHFADVELRNHSGLLSTTDLLISGTGWQTSHEFSMMEQALNAGKEVIAVLDHWVNYSERFARDQRVLSPTYYLVFDDYAEEIVTQTFENPRILRAENYYLQNAVTSINELMSSMEVKNVFDILFIGEPLLRNNTNTIWNEFNAINLLFDTLRIKGLFSFKIAIKPHPTEDLLKYAKSIPKDFPNVTIEGNRSLEELIACAGLVAGCHSLALYIAEAAGKQVLTCLPTGEKSLIPLINAKPIQS